MDAAASPWLMVLDIRHCTEYAKTQARRNATLLDAFSILLPGLEQHYPGAMTFCGADESGPCSVTAAGCTEVHDYAAYGVFIVICGVRRSITVVFVFGCYSV